MKPEGLSRLSDQELATMNFRHYEEANRNLLAIGALWSEIDKRKLWKEWGFNSLGEAIEERAPRGYATVMESIQNYDFFVRENRLSYDNYEYQLANIGMRKMTYVRQAYHIKIETALPNERSQETALAHSLEDIKMKTVREARTFVLEGARDTGIRVERMIERHYRLPENEDQLWQSTIAFIKRRVDTSIADHTALSFALQEYMSIVGTQKIKER